MFTLVVYTDWLVQTLVRKGLGLIVLHLQGDAWKWEWLHFFICSIFIEKLTRTQGISSLVPVLPIPAPWTFYKSGSSVCAKGASLKWAVLGGDFSHRGHVWHLVERKPISPFTCSTLGEVNGLIQFLNFGRSTALVHLGFILLSWERTFLQMTCLLGFRAKYCGETPPGVGLLRGSADVARTFPMSRSQWSSASLFRKCWELLGCSSVEESHQSIWKNTWALKYTPQWWCWQVGRTLTKRPKTYRRPPGKTYCHCAAQLCKSRLLTELQGRQPFLLVFFVSIISWKVWCRAGSNVGGCLKSVLESFLSEGREERLPPGRLQARLSWKMLPRSSRRMARLPFPWITASLQTLTDTTYGRAKCGSHMWTVGMLDIRAKGRLQTQIILKFFTSWIADPWGSRKFVYFLFWDPGQACGRLIAESWKSSGTRKRHRVCAHLLTSGAQAAPRHSEVCRTLMSVSSAHFPLFLSRSGPNGFLREQSKCLLMTCRFWTWKGKKESKLRSKFLFLCHIPFFGSKVRSTDVRLYRVYFYFQIRSFYRTIQFSFVFCYKKYFILFY